MRIRTLIGVIVLLLVLLVAGGVAYIKSIDPNQYKGYIAQKVKDATGRELRIEGPITLSVGWTPALVVEGASFSNASWGTRPEMAKIKRLEVEVDLWPLIRSREIHLHRLVLIQPDILLETNKQGRSNWELAASGGDGAKDAEEKGKGGEPRGGGQPQGDGGGGMPAGLGLDTRVENGLVTYRDARTGQTRKATIGLLTFGAKALDTPVAFDFKGAYSGIPLLAKGQTGPLARVLRASGPFPVDLEFTFGDVESSVTGQIGDIGKMSGIDLRFKAASGGLASIQSVVGQAVGASGKFSLAAHVKGDMAALDVNGLRLTSGKSDIAGRLKVGLKGERPSLSGELRSDRLVLTELLSAEAKKQAARGRGWAEAAEPGKPPEKIEPGPAGPKNAAGPRGKFFPDEALPLDALLAVDADIRYMAGEVVAPRAFLRQVSAHAVLRNGNLSVQPLTANTAGGTIHGSAVVDANAKTAAVNLKVKGVDVGQLLKNASQSDWVTGKADLAVDLKGRGASVAALMASLDGETRLIMSKGAASTAGIDYVIGGFTQVLGTLLATGKTSVVLNCAAADFEVKKGVATSRALVADSPYSTIAGEGKIDLGRETFDMRVVPRPKAVTLNVSVPIKIGGTFQNPNIRPDELAVARKLAGLVGIFAFPPAAVLGLGELGTWDNPCIQILKGEGVPKSAQPSDSITDTGKKAVEGIKKGVEGVGEGVKKGIEELGEGLKGLLGK